ncbi:hypothetical protein CCZ37_12395 [Vibrio qinghaiensis]|uniref:Uncharacterized protein n=1 Tax=Vibrio qinghaiensis TaxID=2025808 RepID=A0A223N0P7_9VIBR|nr:hypothetical protein CCZ37_12395 [Vibrio qinghaiensis]
MSELTNPFMHFQIIKDYRQENKIAHKLSDIIDFGNSRLDFLKRYGHFEADIPSADQGKIMNMPMFKGFVAW